MDLTGRVAVVTGAGQGIGRATAEALAAAGAFVVVNDIDGERAEEVCRTIGARAVPCVAAIGSAEAAEACVARAVEAFGRMDAMICNAGLLRDRVLWKTSDEDFDAVIATHLRGTFTCARAAATHFRAAGEGGRLILVSSVAGQRGNFGQTAYAAAKAGIAAMARTWSMELARSNVTVNAVVPTALTAMTATVPALSDYARLAEGGEPIPREARERLSLGTAQDVAPLFVYLASEASAHVTGQCIGLGGDRLAVWRHPVEAEHALEDGGWTAEGIAAAMEGPLSSSLQTVGIDLD